MPQLEGIFGITLSALILSIRKMRLIEERGIVPETINGSKVSRAQSSPSQGSPYTEPNPSPTGTGGWEGRRAEFPRSGLFSKHCREAQPFCLGDCAKLLLPKTLWSHHLSPSPHLFLQISSSASCPSPKPFLIPQTSLGPDDKLSTPRFSPIALVTDVAFLVAS